MIVEASKNPKDFFMEAYTDNKLKNFLQNRAGVLDLKPAKGKVATLWSDFVNLIKSMFGIPEYAHSMLDEILLLSPELMKGPGAVTTGKEVSQARQAPEGITRPDGTPLKYFEADQDSLWQKTKNAYDNKRKWFDLLGNKIIGNRYSVERKGIDADIPEVDDWFHRIYFDKWVHAGMFGILAFLFMWPFQKSDLPNFRKKQLYLVIAILTSCWGFATECIQRYVPGRSYDLLDWVADSFGVIIVLIFARKRML